MFVSVCLFSVRGFRSRVIITCFVIICVSFTWAYPGIYDSRDNLGVYSGDGSTGVEPLLRVWGKAPEAGDKCAFGLYINESKNTKQISVNANLLVSRKIYDDRKSFNAS